MKISEKSMFYVSGRSAPFGSYKEAQRYVAYVSFEHLIREFNLVFPTDMTSIENVSKLLENADVVEAIESLSELTAYPVSRKRDPYARH